MGNNIRKNKSNKGSTLNFLNISLFTFIYVTFSAIVINFYYKGIPSERQILASSETLGATSESVVQTKVSRPYLSPSATPLTISAVSAEAVDVASGEILYEKSPNTPVFPASTTKIVTALVALDTYSPNRIITVGNVLIDGQKMGLVPGEQIKVSDLIYGLLVESANDAAEVLADSYPGGRQMFIAAMNLKAEEIGLKNTLFTNPTGLDQAGQLTTSDDLIRASLYAMAIPTFAKTVATKEITVTSLDGKYIHNLRNINRLLGEVEGVKGVKTGYTEGARENLVTYVERGKKKVVIAVLGSQDRFGESENLINWIYSNYSWD